MMPLRSIPLALVLISCDDSMDVAPAASAGAAPASATATPVSSTAAPVEEWERTASSTSTESDVDPWVVFSSAVQRLNSGEQSKEITRLLEDRALRREVEDRRIQRALIDVEAALTMGCSPDDIEDIFNTFLLAESASLTADRDALRAILDAATPEGRVMIWSAGSPEEVIPAPREKMAFRLSSNLESNWVNTQTDPEKHQHARRTMLGLKFGIKALNLDVETELAEFQAAIAQFDEDSAKEDATVDTVMAALQRVDETLLTGQADKFSRLVPACESIDDDIWLRLLDGGQINRYIGQLGGTTGVKASASTSADKQNSATSQSSRGQQSRSQSKPQLSQGQSGQQMGQGQTGQQMGQSQGGQQMGQGQTGQQMGQSQQTGQGQNKLPLSQGQSGQQMGQGQTGQQMGQGQTGQQMGQGQTGQQMGQGQTGQQMGQGQTGQGQNNQQTGQGQNKPPMGQQG